MKAWHRLALAVGRGLQDVRIEACLTVVAVNLKRFAGGILAAFLAPFDALVDPRTPPQILAAS